MRQDFVSEKKIYQARTTVDNLASFSAEDREAMMQLLNKQKKRQAQGGPGGPGDLGDLVICLDASLRKLLIAELFFHCVGIGQGSQDGADPD